MKLPTMTFEWFPQWNIAFNPLEYCIWAIPWESGQEGLKKSLGIRYTTDFLPSIAKFQVCTKQ